MAMPCCGCCCIMGCIDGIAAAGTCIPGGSSMPGGAAIMPAAAAAGAAAGCMAVNWFIIWNIIWPRSFSNCPTFSCRGMQGVGAGRGNELTGNSGQHTPHT